MVLKSCHYVNKIYKQIHQVSRPQFVPVPELPVLSALPHHSDLLAANNLVATSGV